MRGKRFWRNEPKETAGGAGTSDAVISHIRNRRRAAFIGGHASRTILARMYRAYEPSTDICLKCGSGSPLRGNVREKCVIRRKC